MYDLGLTDAETWELTPRQFDLLWQQHLAAERRMDRRFALLATLYTNVHRDPKIRATPFTLDDFVPGAVIAPANQATQSVDQMIATARMFTESWNARQRGRAA